MSIFPTKVLVATDGSREAELASRTAADLAQKTHSELHVVHAFGVVPVGPPVYPEATDFQSVEYEAETEERRRISGQRAREVLEAEVQKTVENTSALIYCLLQQKPDTYTFSGAIGDS